MRPLQSPQKTRDQVMVVCRRKRTMIPNQLCRMERFAHRSPAPHSPETVGFATTTVFWPRIISKNPDVRATL
jgi:hypothetical protein